MVGGVRRQVRMYLWLVGGGSFTLLVGCGPAGDKAAGPGGVTEWQRSPGAPQEAVDGASLFGRLDALPPEIGLSPSRQR